MGAHQHALARHRPPVGGAGQRRRRQRGLRPAARRRAEGGRDAARHPVHSVAGRRQREARVPLGQRRPHEPGVLGRRQAVGRGQHRGQDAQRSDARRRGVVRAGAVAGERAAAGVGRGAGLRFAQRPERDVSVDRGQRRRSRRHDLHGRRPRLPPERRLRHHRRQRRRRRARRRGGGGARGRLHRLHLLWRQSQRPLGRLLGRGRRR